MVSQALYPAGIRGRVFARLMEWLNSPAYKCALSLIDPLPNDRVLEIGFGTGALLSMLAPRLPEGLLAGLDPSPLMVQWARGRLKSFETHSQIDARQGDDRDIDWPPGYFSHVVALHCFQFWSNPHDTLKNIRRVLHSGGQLTLILRSHARRKPEWLPNAISRSADEIAGTIDALERAGFEQVRSHAMLRSSAVITARAKCVAEGKNHGQ